MPGPCCRLPWNPDDSSPFNYKQILTRLAKPKDYEYTTSYAFVPVTGTNQIIYNGKGIAK